MKKRLLSALIGSTALMLASCATTISQPAFSELGVDEKVAFFQSVQSITYDELAGEADFTALKDAFDGDFRISYGTFSPVGEGVEARDVKLTFAAYPAVGIKIDGLRIYGFDSEALVEAGTHRMADRIDAQGISVFGWETLMQGFVDESYEVAANTLEDTSDDAQVTMPLDEIKPSFENYDFSAGRLILDDFSLHREAETPDVSDNKLMALLQALARYSGGYSFKNGVVYDLNVKTASSTKLTGSTSQISTPLIGYRSYDRGDAEAVVMKGMSYSVKSTVSPQSDVLEVNPDDKSVFESVTLNGSVDTYLIENIQLAKLYDYLSQGQIPPQSDTDLMSFGHWTSMGEEMSIGDVMLYSVASQSVDLSQWHWLVPTAISAEAKDVRYNIDGLITYMTTLASGMAEEEGSEIEELQKFQDYTDILNKYDLGTPVLNTSLSLDWDPIGGGTQSKLYFDVREFGSVSFDSKMVLPTFENFATQTKSEDGSFSSDALGALLASQAKFGRTDLLIEDKGGILKTFGLAIDFAKLDPENSPIMLTNGTPDGLRGAASGLVQMGAMQAAAQFPPAQDWANAVAEWIKVGGRIRFTYAPASPLGAADFEALGTAPDATPASLVETLGVSVVHTP